jgi:hypothetical protein
MRLTTVTVFYPPTTFPHTQKGIIHMSTIHDSITIAPTSIGEPVVADGVGVYPLIGGTIVGEGVILADGRLQVSEQPTATVPVLEVYNPTDTPMIIPAGRVLEGGRQTRVVNVTIVVPKRTRMPIPVSCVEQGRWHGGKDFRDRRRYAGRRVRVAKQAAVVNAVRATRGKADRLIAKQADQGAVWFMVDDELQSRGIHNSTDLYMDVDDFVDRDTRSAAVLRQLMAKGPQAGQTGIAVTVGGRVAGVEVFPSEVALREAWEGLIRQAVLELPTVPSRAEAGVADIERFLARVAAAETSAAPGVGLGRELHASTDEFVAHAVELDGVLVYANAFAKA